MPKGKATGWISALTFGLLAMVLSACSDDLAEAPPMTGSTPAPLYRIGPGNSLLILVWRNEQLTTSVPVRPDGRISVPLIEDLQAAGKTPSELSRDMEAKLSTYVREPLVTVVVSGFIGTFDEQVRVIGEAQRPLSLPYRENMSALDVMIAVGGLTPFAAGNRAVIVRQVEGRQQQYRVRLDDLVKDGEISANVAMLPGDIMIIPQVTF